MQEKYFLLHYLDGRNIVLVAIICIIFYPVFIVEFEHILHLSLAFLLLTLNRLIFFGYIYIIIIYKCAWVILFR